LVYHAQGRYSEAEPLYQRSLGIWEQQLGSDHPDVARSLNNLAEFYRAQERYSEAEPLYLRSRAIWEKQLGQDHPDVAISLNNLAELYRVQGCYGQAEPLYIRAVNILVSQLGETHPTTQTCNQNFLLLLHQAFSADQTGLLSDHPLTQKMLHQIQIANQGHLIHKLKAKDSTGRWAYYFFRNPSSG
jgi:tetratricopeptide (TPR) repeat protein